MPTLTFRGVRIRYLDIRPAEAGLFCRAHLTADYSEPVIKAMDWGDLCPGIESAKLEGALCARNVVLTPNGKGLEKHELQFEADEVSDFAVYRVKDGDSVRTELRFIVRSLKPMVGSFIEDYWRKIGDGVAQMRVTFEKQDELPLEGDAA